MSTEPKSLHLHAMATDLVPDPDAYDVKKYAEKIKFLGEQMKETKERYVKQRERVIRIKRPCMRRLVKRGKRLCLRDPSVPEDVPEEDLSTDDGESHPEISPVVKDPIAKLYDGDSGDGWSETTCEFEQFNLHCRLVEENGHRYILPGASPQVQNIYTNYMVGLEMLKSEREDTAAVEESVMRQLLLALHHCEMWEKSSK